MAEPALEEFAAVMRRLRAECPWKREQTHRSLVRYLIEESHETVEAIESGDTEHLREELGDLLLQVFLHATIAEERGDFTLDEVAADATAKMRRRNPHVFGDVEAADADAASAAWEAAKAGEKRRTGPTDGIPPGLPALLYADKVLGRLPDAQRWSSARSEERAAGVLRPPEDRIGDQLLALVADARAEGVDPEQALRGAVRRLRV